MDGALLTAEDFDKIANLESREVLLAKLAGMMKAKQGQAAALFAAPLSKAARAVGALQTKLEADPSAAASAQAPAADAPAQEAPAEEAPAQEATTEEETTQTPDAPAEDSAEAAETTEG